MTGKTQGEVNHTNANVGQPSGVKGVKIGVFDGGANPQRLRRLLSDKRSYP
jgi:hypothetical protein